MRVLHIGKFYPPFAGGMEYFLADLLTSLHTQGVQVAALVHDDPNGRGRKSPRHHHYDSNSVYRVRCYGRLLYAPISPSFPYWLARTIRQFKPDILHLHLPNTSAFWALLVPAARRLPWVIHWQSDVVASLIDRRLALAYRAYAPFEQRLLAKSNAVIVASPTYLEASLPLQAWRQKCHVIPLGLNPERISVPSVDATARTNRIWGEGFRVLSVGRLTYYKGHDVLIRAVARQPDMKLIIIGEGERRAQLEALIDQLGIEERVSLLGFQAEQDLNAWFATCDVFCLPSLERTEAFGLVLLESMYFQKPVVASDISGSGVNWVVQQGQHGLLATPNSPESLLDTLLTLKQSPQLRLQLGAAGQKSLQKQFHITQVSRQIVELYQSIL